MCPSAFQAGRAANEAYQGLCWFMRFQKCAFLYCNIVYVFDSPQREVERRVWVEDTTVQIIWTNVCHHAFITFWDFFWVGIMLIHDLLSVQHNLTSLIFLISYMWLLMDLH